MDWIKGATEQCDVHVEAVSSGATMPSRMVNIIAGDSFLSVSARLWSTARGYSNSATFFAIAYFRASMPSPVTAEMGCSSSFLRLQ